MPKLAIKEVERRRKMRRLLEELRRVAPGAAMKFGLLSAMPADPDVLKYMREKTRVPWSQFTEAEMEDYPEGTITPERKRLDPMAFALISRMEAFKKLARMPEMMPLGKRGLSTVAKPAGTKSVTVGGKRFFKAPEETRKDLWRVLEDIPDDVLDWIRAVKWERGLGRGVSGAFSPIGPEAKFSPLSEMRKGVWPSRYFPRIVAHEIGGHGVIEHVKPWRRRHSQKLRAAKAWMEEAGITKPAPQYKYDVSPHEKFAAAAEQSLVGRFEELDWGGRELDPEMLQHYNRVLEILHRDPKGFVTGPTTVKLEDIRGYMKTATKYMKEESRFAPHIKNVRVAGSLVKKGGSRKDVDIVIQLNKTPYVRSMMETEEGLDKLIRDVTDELFWEGGIHKLQSALHESGWLADEELGGLDPFVQIGKKNYQLATDPRTGREFIEEW